MISLVYGDDRLLVISKPSGLLTHPKADSPTALDVLHQLKILGHGWTYPIHRLDRPTSGLLVLAKKSSDVALIQEQWHSGLIYKAYLGLCRGRFPDTLQAERPLTCPETKRPQTAVTSFQSLKRGPNWTLIRALPRTGRTHQIRRHLAHQGHHLIGDTTYGKGRINQAARERGLHRLFLHASELGFWHPWRQTWIHLFDPLPRELALYFNALSQADHLGFVSEA